MIAAPIIASTTHRESAPRVIIVQQVESLHPNFIWCNTDETESKLQRKYKLGKSPSIFTFACLIILICFFKSLMGKMLQSGLDVDFDILHICMKALINVECWKGSCCVHIFLDLSRSKFLFKTSLVNRKSFRG